MKRMPPSPMKILMFPVSTLASSVTKPVAQVTVKARQNAALNPYAHRKDTYTVEEVLGSRMIADPLHLRRRKSGNWTAWDHPNETLRAARRQD